MARPKRTEEPGLLRRFRLLGLLVSLALALATAVAIPATAAADSLSGHTSDYNGFDQYYTVYYNTSYCATYGNHPLEYSFTKWTGYWHRANSNDTITRADVDEGEVGWECTGGFNEESTGDTVFYPSFSSGSLQTATWYQNLSFDWIDPNALGQYGQVAGWLQGTYHLVHGNNRYICTYLVVFGTTYPCPNT